MSSRSNLHREMNIFLKKINGMFFFLFSHKRLLCFVYVIVIENKFSQIWSRWLFDWQHFLLKKYWGKWQISWLGSERFKLNLNDLKKWTKSFIGAYYLNFSYKS